MPNDQSLSVDMAGSSLTYQPDANGDTVPDFTGVGYENDMNSLPVAGWCSAGIANGNKCCAASCGSCGGSGCTGRPGGASQCCSGTIRNSGVTCSAPFQTGCLVPSTSPAGVVVRTEYLVHPAASGDDTARVQQAIDEVSAMPLNADGYRGAVQLLAGEYRVGASGLTVSASGVVLRGVGDGAGATVLKAVAAEQHTVLAFAGTEGVSADSSTEAAVTAAYVPVGATTVPVAPGSGFQAGDLVVLGRPATAEWITSIGMDRIVGCSPPSCTMWSDSPSAYVLAAERTVTAVAADGSLTLDAAVMQSLSSAFGGGTVTKATDRRIQKVGVADLRIDSATDGTDTDENHAWTAVSFDKVAHGFARGLTCRHIGYSCVHVKRGAKQITVENATSIDPVSIIMGGRRYPFNIDGQRSLFRNCNSEHGRHTYVTGRMATGPNVFVDGVARYDHNDIGPHHRWATGLLFDNIRGGLFAVQDREASGSGHGWTGNTVVFFNCAAQAALGGSRAATFEVQSPAGGVNYCIGCVSDQSRCGRWTCMPMATRTRPWSSHVPCPDMCVERLAGVLARGGTAYKCRPLPPLSQVPARRAILLRRDWPLGVDGHAPPAHRLPLRRAAERS